MLFSQSLDTQVTMIKNASAGGQTKWAHERSVVYHPSPLCFSVHYWSMPVLCWTLNCKYSVYFVSNCNVPVNILRVYPTTKKYTMFIHFWLRFSLVIIHSVNNKILSLNIVHHIEYFEYLYVALVLVALRGLATRPPWFWRLTVSLLSLCYLFWTGVEHKVQLFIYS